MSSFTFASLGHGDKIAYSVRSSSGNSYVFSSGNNTLSPYAVFFQTYGDDLNQHSDVGYVTKEYAGDFLTSLAARLLDEGDLPFLDQIQLVQGMWPVDHRINPQIVMFLHQLKYKADKKTYYFVDEMKTSAKYEKRHDRRWHEVPESADGHNGTELIFSLFNFGYGNLLENYWRYNAIRGILAAQLGVWSGREAQAYFGLDGASYKYFDQAFQAVDHLVQSFKNLFNAKRALECYKYNMTNLSVA